MNDKPVQLKEIYELIINSYSHQGEGIDRIYIIFFGFAGKRF